MLLCYLTSETELCGHVVRLVVLCTAPLDTSIEHPSVDVSESIQRADSPLSNAENASEGVVGTTATVATTNTSTTAAVTSAATTTVNGGIGDEPHLTNSGMSQSSAQVSFVKFFLWVTVVGLN